MCGICGAIAAGNQLIGSELENFQKLLFLNVFRGKDSTGMFDVIRSKEVGQEDKKIVKSHYWRELTPSSEFAVGPFSDLVKSNRWKDNKVVSLIGHSRAATVGKVTKKNTHPFFHGNILGVHNGTVSGEFENSKKFETDSEAIIFNIATFGIDKTIKEIINKSNSSAYALVYYDTNKNEMNIIRNYQRPLHYLVRSNVLYLSSDDRDLKYVFGQHSEVKAFEPNQLYTIPVDTSLPLTLNKREVKPDSYYGGGSVYSNFPRNGEYPGNENNRRYNQYVQAWKKDEVKDFIWRGKKLDNPGSSDAHRWYDIGFDLYFTFTVFDMLQMWILDHKEEYNKYFEENWKLKSDDEKRACIEKIEESALVPDLITQLFTALRKKKENRSVVPSVPKKQVHEKDSPLIPFGTRGLKCTSLAFYNKTRDGCCYCGNPVAPGDKIFWVNEKEFLCENDVNLAATTNTHEIHQLVDTTGIEEFYLKHYFNKEEKVSNVH